MENQTDKDKASALKKDAPQVKVHEATPPVTQPNKPEPGHLGEPDKKTNMREEKEQSPTQNATAGDASGKPVNQPGMSNS